MAPAPRAGSRSPCGPRKGGGGDPALPADREDERHRGVADPTAAPSAVRRGPGPWSAHGSRRRPPGEWRPRSEGRSPAPKCRAPGRARIRRARREAGLGTDRGASRGRRSRLRLRGADRDGTAAMAIPCPRGRGRGRAARPSTGRMARSARDRLRRRRGGRGRPIRPPADGVRAPRGRGLRRPRRRARPDDRTRDRDGDRRPAEPDRTAGRLARHSLDLWLTSEDLPLPGDRIRTEGGRARLDLAPTDVEAHARLRAELRDLVGRTGAHPRLLDRSPSFGPDAPIGGTAHQTGTMRFGPDPATSVLDLDRRAHGIDNLHVADARFFPSTVPRQRPWDRSGLFLNGGCLVHRSRKERR